MYLVVDAGNTRIKLALFKQGELLQLLHFKNVTDLTDNFDLNAQPTIISSVLDDVNTAELFDFFTNAYALKDLEIPVGMAYKTPESLGGDRLANAVAISKLTTGNRLAIDLGTCIKFDFVDANDVYQGGSISPGVQMRFRAMHDYTGKLPLLSPEVTSSYIGKTTNESMQIGVLTSLQHEIDSLIKSYEKDYADLTIFVTGGDAKYFDYSSKKHIFANENLTILGLYHILVENVS